MNVLNIEDRIGGVLVFIAGDPEINPQFVGPMSSAVIVLVSE